MPAPSNVIRSASHAGTRPPCSGRSAMPERFIPLLYAYPAPRLLGTGQFSNTRRIVAKPFRILSGRVEVRGCLEEFIFTITRNLRGLCLQACHLLLCQRLK